MITKVLTAFILAFSHFSSLCTRRCNSHLQRSKWHQRLLKSDQADSKSSGRTSRIYWRSWGCTTNGRMETRMSTKKSSAMAERWSFLIVGSGICHRILCLRWDSTFTRGSKNPLYSSDSKGNTSFYAVGVIGGGSHCRHWSYPNSDYWVHLLGLLVTAGGVYLIFQEAGQKRTRTTRPKISIRYSFFQKDSTTKDF